MVRIRDLGEIGLIERAARNLRLDKTVIKGAGDDAAVIRWTRDKYLLFACDMIVEDVHFRRQDATPYQIGWKALARNLSDIAAMGGVGRYAVVSAGLDPEAPVSLADGIWKGLNAIAKRFGVSIVGGDTVRSKKLILDVSLIGEVKKNNLVLRGGAKPGDAILVTGPLGGSIKKKHLSFVPRVKEAGQLVRNFKINSMIDISDGLVLDLRRILAASGTGARIYESLIPISGEATSFMRAISDGEDFELLLTMSAPDARRLLKTAPAKIRPAPILIGEITGRGRGLVLVRKDGREERLKPKGYVHF
jgi:thiamine-monophosphate kinase